MNDEKIKLNLGSGETVIDGFVNIDRKTGGEVFPLSEEVVDGSIDEIRASHVLEHFSYKETFEVMKHWLAKLKPGGILKIAVPDFAYVAKKYTEGKAINTAGYLMGGQTDDNDYHKSLFDDEALRELMRACGLTNVCKWTSEINDCANLDVSLNLMGTKPAEALQGADVASGAAGGVVNSKIDCSKIGAVISMGRLTFSDNQFCAARALAPLGVKLIQGIGVFWGQILTRGMQEMIDEGKEYILTLDYDTYFNREQFLYLCWMMENNPEVDAVVPLQMKREGEFPLFGKYSADEFPKGQTTAQVPMSVFNNPLTPIVTGHFGMTLFRVSALKKLSKPWFLPQANPDGEWGEGRVDEDIFFWNKFHSEGFKAMLAREVGIGHLQLMATFPGEIEDNWKPIHKYITDVREEGMPKHCVPFLETKVNHGKG